MAANVNVAESAVAVGAAGTNQQVRNLITNVLVNGVLTPVIMQVTVAADRNGNLLDMDIGRKLDAIYNLLGLLYREARIANELAANRQQLSFPTVPAPRVEEEYRNGGSLDIVPPIT